MTIQSNRRRIATDADWQALGHKLRCSEWRLIEEMKEHGRWVGSLPDAPPPDYRKVGDLEFGTFLLLVHHPERVALPLNRTERTEIGKSLDIGKLQRKLQSASAKLPKPILTPEHHDRLAAEDEWVAADGTIMGTGQYEGLDPYWVLALVNMLDTDWNDSYYNGGSLPLPQSTFQPVSISSGKEPGVVRIGLISDWGTGDNDAMQVLSALTADNPDCLVHLGDVYYSGTPQPPTDYIQPNEETDFLVNVWPSGYDTTSFTMNSNHEMYCGAQGLFYDALTAAGAPFASQNGLSVFALAVGDWTLLGLDSAFNGTSTDLFMQGTLGQDQIQWIQGLGLSAGKVVVLTHHTGFDYGSSGQSQLWTDVNSALSGDPYAWYWGHTHNGIVYSQPVQSPVQSDTYCRCLGHGALPFGVASELQGAAGVEWFAQNTKPAPYQDRVYNGCAVLKFTLNDQNTVTCVSEHFKSSDPDNPEPFQSVIFGTPSV